MTVSISTEDCSATANMLWKGLLLSSTVSTESCMSRALFADNSNRRSVEAIGMTSEGIAGNSIFRIKSNWLALHRELVLKNFEAFEGSRSRS